MNEGFKSNVLSPLEKLKEEVREIFRKEYKGKASIFIIKRWYYKKLGKKKVFYFWMWKTNFKWNTSSKKFWRI